MTSVDASGENERQEETTPSLHSEDGAAQVLPADEAVGGAEAAFAGESQTDSGGSDTEGATGLGAPPESDFISDPPSSAGESSAGTFSAAEDAAIDSVDSNELISPEDPANSSEQANSDEQAPVDRPTDDAIPVYDGGESGSADAAAAAFAELGAPQDEAPAEASAGSEPEDDGRSSGDSMQLLFEELLRAMGVQGTIRVKDESPDQVTLDILNCPDASLIIGRHGQTVDDLQYLGGLILNNNRRDRKRFMLNVENYRERREETLRHSAITLARQVAEFGQEAVLDPLPPHERRIIHMAVLEIPEVYTYSEGQEPDRRIVISPRNIPAQAVEGNGYGQQEETAAAAGVGAADSEAIESGELPPPGDTEFGMPTDPAQGAGHSGLDAGFSPEGEDGDSEAGHSSDDGAAQEARELPETPHGGGSEGGHTGVDGAD